MKTKRQIKNKIKELESTPSDTNDMTLAIVVGTIEALYWVIEE